MTKLSKDTIIGIILGFGLFIYSIFASTDNYLMFLNLPGFLMVLGGTLAASMISFRGRTILRAFIEMFKILLPVQINKQTLYAEVKTIIEWGRIVRSKGLFELEKYVADKKIKDPVMKYGLELLLTGYRGDELREMLENVSEAIYEKNMSTAYILRTMGSYSPAFGMVGTLVGLIIMLDNLGGDSSKLGKGLAVALLTTLYGVLMSHLIFKPAAEKIQQKEELVKFRNMLLTEGFVLLSESQDSITIQDKLNSFLDPENHFAVVKK